jgi:tRNA-uridine 2-sulfurtransferase
MNHRNQSDSVKSDPVKAGPIKADPIKALGLCSGGLDSMVSALLLKKQGIEVSFICFETPFFSSDSAKKASLQTGIPLITKDITKEYMEMMKKPKAGFGKNMNPCMDCHALMFSRAGELLKEQGCDFLFSGEVVGQRPKSQNKNSLRYVEKNSGFDGYILRPLSAKIMPITLTEQEGLVDREQLMGISGRSRKIQMQMAEEFGIKDYPAPAGGCLLTDKIFSQRLKDLMYVQLAFETHEIHLLKYGRHFRLDSRTKLIVGRSKADNEGIIKYFNKKTDVLIKHTSLPGPVVILTGQPSPENIGLAAEICAAYTTHAPQDKSTSISVSERGTIRQIEVKKAQAEDFRRFMV